MPPRKTGDTKLGYFSRIAGDFLSEKSGNAADRSLADCTMADGGGARYVSLVAGAV